MRFPDDKDKDKEKEKEKEKENINGAECERKQGNDEDRHCKKEENTRNAIVSQRCACNDAMFLRVKRRSYSRTIQSNM